MENIFPLTVPVLLLQAGTAEYRKGKGKAKHTIIPVFERKTRCVSGEILLRDEMGKRKGKKPKQRENSRMIRTF